MLQTSCISGNFWSIPMCSQLEHCILMPSRFTHSLAFKTLLGCRNSIPYKAWKKHTGKYLLNLLFWFACLQRVICSCPPWQQIMVSVSKPYHQQPDPDSFVLNCCYTVYNSKHPVLWYSLNQVTPLTSNHRKMQFILLLHIARDQPHLATVRDSKESLIFQNRISLFQILTINTSCFSFHKVKCPWCRFHRDPMAVHQD